ncbi:hypothetical protein [Streptomyces sp. NPDC010273]|uniref:hypothetical protein n=1 Tax=Streptomyces sp. NPDC010273 TaxID=3364829 RepID=UPI0036F05922
MPRTATGTPEPAEARAPVTSPLTVPPEVVFTEELLSDVYDQAVEVFPHPCTGAVVVTPHRPA